MRPDLLGSWRHEQSPRWKRRLLSTEHRQHKQQHDAQRHLHSRHGGRRGNAVDKLGPFACSPHFVTVLSVVHSRHLRGHVTLCRTIFNDACNAIESSRPNSLTHKHIDASIDFRVPRSSCHVEVDQIEWSSAIDQQHAAATQHTKCSVAFSQKRSPPHQACTAVAACPSGTAQQPASFIWLIQQSQHTHYRSEQRKVAP
jgi:hypothetical protein